MPADFEKCVREGGRVRTKQLSGGRYIHICFKNNKSYAGEVKKKKRTSKDVLRDIERLKNAR